MWFKNLLMYRLTQELDLTNLEEALETKRAKPCTFQELSSYGFVAPYGKSEDAPLVHCRQGFYLIAARKEERIMPASVINKELRKKVDEIEALESRKVYKKEKDQLKDDIVQSILPKALIKESITYAVIAPKLELILVDTTSTAKAESLLSTLREALEGLPVRPFATKIDIATTLTGWVKNQQAHAGFTILEDCQLEDDFDSKGVIRCKNQDLTNETILDHLKSGMLVTSLSLNWKDKLSFVLDKKLGIKRIKFDDVILEEASKEGADNSAEQFDMNFILMMFTFAEFIPELIQALGGNEEITPIEKPSSTFDQFALYEDAVTIVKASGNARTSHLQRQLKIGYNHASILLERMERESIVSAPNIMTGKRTVLSPTS